MLNKLSAVRACCKTNRMKLSSLFALSCLVSKLRVIFTSSTQNDVMDDRKLVIELGVRNLQIESKNELDDW